MAKLAAGETRWQGQQAFGKGSVGLTEQVGVKEQQAASSGQKTGGLTGLKRLTGRREGADGRPEFRMSNVGDSSDSMESKDSIESSQEAAGTGKSKQFRILDFEFRNAGERDAGRLRGAEGRQSGQRAQPTGHTEQIRIADSLMSGYRSNNNNWLHTSLSAVRSGSCARA